MLQISIPCPAVSPLAPICERLTTQMRNIYQHKARMWRLGRLLNGIMWPFEKNDQDLARLLADYNEWGVLDAAAALLRAWPVQMWDLGDLLIQFAEAGLRDPAAFSVAGHALAEEYPPSYQDFLTALARTVPRPLVEDRGLSEEDLFMLGRLPPAIAIAVLKTKGPTICWWWFWQNMRPVSEVPEDEAPERITEILDAVPPLHAAHQGVSLLWIETLGDAASRTDAGLFCQGGMDIDKAQCLTARMKTTLLPVIRTLRHDSLRAAFGAKKRVEAQEDSPRLAERIALKVGLACDALLVSKAPNDAHGWGISKADRILKARAARRGEISAGDSA